jgi:hypothetical protein
VRGPATVVRLVLVVRVVVDVGWVELFVRLAVAGKLAL